MQGLVQSKDGLSHCLTQPPGNLGETLAEAHWLYAALWWHELSWPGVEEARRCYLNTL